MSAPKRQVAEYFVVVGLNDSSQRFDASDDLEDALGENGSHGPEKMDLPDAARPITDISVVFAGAGERLPSDYEGITVTPSKYCASLNHGSSNTSKAVYLCFKRGLDSAPLTDIDITYRSPQQVDYQVVTTSVMSFKTADINHSATSPATYLAYRRAPHTGSGGRCHFYGMAITDLCLISGSKNEAVPRGFTMINKAIHAGLTGPTFYLCYKKSLVKPHAIAYRAGILHRFPLEDCEDFPLPEAVPLFCLPLGASVESWSSNVAHPLPTFSSFVLTGAVGEKVYGAAVVFYEELPESQQSPGMRDALFGADAKAKTNRVFCNKAICVLSRFPFFQAFKNYLSSLYRISISGPSPIPLERYISNFMLDVPFPSSSRPRVLIQLGPESVLLSQPVKTALPLSGSTHSILLRCLDSTNLILLMVLLLHEHQVILHSVRPSLLTSFGEAMCSILFPFQWQCPYIPLCPIALASFIHAPMPFIVGIDSRYFDLYDPPEDCVCVNLDNNTIAHSFITQSALQQLLPKKPAAQLGRTLKQLQVQVPLSTDLDSDLAVAVVPPPSDLLGPSKSDSVTLNLAIREAFLRFNAQVLCGYSGYLRPLTRAPSQGSTDISQLFDLRGFLKSRPGQEHTFFSKFFQTQLFIHFIEHRSFTTSENSGTLAFFDECAAKADSPEPLVTLKEKNKAGSDMTVVANPPDLAGLDDTDYVYETFTLNESLFCASKPPSEVCSVGEVSTPPAASTTVTDSAAMAVFQRTTAERAKSLEVASNVSDSPNAWANYLYSHVYALWFLHLPAFAQAHSFKREALSLAFRVFDKMDEQKVDLPDEVSYRVVMDLCAKLGHPMLAVRVLMELRRVGKTPNAVTYAYYNKAMLECDWTTKAHMWRTLQNVIHAISRLKRLLKEKRDGQAALKALASADRVSIEKAKQKAKGHMSSTRNSGSMTSDSDDILVFRRESPTEPPPHSGPLAETPELPDDCYLTKGKVIRHRRGSSLSLSPHDCSPVNLQPISALRRQSDWVAGSFSSTPSLENIAPVTAGTPTHSSVSSQDAGTFIVPRYSKEMTSRTANSSPIKARKGNVQRQTTLNSLAASLQQVVRGNLRSQVQLPRPAHVEAGSEITARVRISSSVCCHHCHCVLYDEQVMSRWKADDSNLNTSCCYCGKSLVSFLVIEPECYDLRTSATLPMMSDARTSSSPPGLNIDSFSPSHGTHHATVETSTLPQISVPYLSPLLLRKELETLLAQDGTDCMATPAFVDQHPVIYWNLMYYFVRLNLSTKLASLFSSSQYAESHGVRPGAVAAHLVWHIARDGDDSTPFYQRWLSRGMQPNFTPGIERDELSSQLQSLAARLQCGDYNAPMAAMLKERVTARRIATNPPSPGKSDPATFRSVYWELLCFLAVVRGIGLDLSKFEREYSRAVGRLPRDLSAELRQDDHGPDSAALAFRSRFGSLNM